MKKIVFSFGRFQPPTPGHLEMIQYGQALARRIGGEYRVYPSKSHDQKNPLPYPQKLAFLRQLFPGVNIVNDPSAQTPFAICRKLSDEGATEVTMVVGGDRVQEFKTQIGKYVMPSSNPLFDKSRNYNFEKFDVVNSGNRRSGISGTDMRNLIKRNQLKKFNQMAPTNNKSLSTEIFNTAKKYLREDNLNEEMDRKSFRKILKGFVDFTAADLELDNLPTIKFKDDNEQGDQPSFGGYQPHSKTLIVATKNRHPMDIFRTVSHELVHHKQNLEGRLGQTAYEGSDGSEIENEANSRAAVTMRRFGKANPDMFKQSYVTEKKSEADENFENMLNEVGGAGSEGTGKLTGQYQKDTPGQHIGFHDMKVLDMVKFNKEKKKTKEKLGQIPIGKDRIGDEYGEPKSAGFGDNQTIPYNMVNDPIGRWMVKEETVRRFKERYGELSDKKLKEAAERLYRSESIDDPFNYNMGATPNAANQEYNRPDNPVQVDREKESLFRQRLRTKKSIKAK